MTWRARRTAAVGAAVAVGLLMGGAVGLLAQGAPGSPAARQPAGGGPNDTGVGIGPGSGLGSTPASGPPVPAVTPVAASTLLAWTPGGLPAGFSASVSNLPGVERAVAVVSGTAWMTRSTSAEGATVDRPPAGLAIPLEVAGADLGAYGPFLSPADRALLPSLADGQVALGATSAGLRRLGTGGVLAFGSTVMRVGGVLPNASIGASEVFASRATAARLGITQERYLLIDPSPGASREVLTARIRGLLAAGTPLRIRGPGETPFFRQGDAVLPPVQMKILLGEFAARALPDGTLRIDPAWLERHLQTASVPILGPVSCNRAVVPQLRGALEEVVREGLSGLIDPADSSGCFSARFNRGSTGSTSIISHHTWGAAADINVSTNRYGGTPHMDPRIVAIFERWGFTWGGRWLIPDGMHFDFVRFAPGA